MEPPVGRFGLRPSPPRECVATHPDTGHGMGTGSAAGALLPARERRAQGRLPADAVAPPQAERPTWCGGRVRDFVPDPVRFVLGVDRAPCAPSIAHVAPRGSPRGR